MATRSEGAESGSGCWLAVVHIARAPRPQGLGRAEWRCAAPVYSVAKSRLSVHHVTAADAVRPSCQNLHVRGDPQESFLPSLLDASTHQPPTAPDFSPSTPPQPSLKLECRGPLWRFLRRTACPRPGPTPEHRPRHWAPTGSGMPTDSSH
ncbi:hypothetical protein NHX12_033965 [Muraenolepis orangiensis]|uniref:Uncharacterized protein n=1 Tax=Muraenolepis orangiensis TaxID=630683 RepID=A0A9Q0IJ57_9TELE|nr:hypothetical protein NHX12_033965 [Muraenolepis orangiensis]